MALLRIALCAAALLIPMLLRGDESRPNIIFILVDDLGATDLTCTGSSFYRTPQIDKLAAEGMRFTNAYSACTVCSPTRAAFLTGKYPARLHVTDWISGHDRPFAKLKPPAWTQKLVAEETTIAELLAKNGYATALMGKWHLGPDGEGPTTHGFATNIGGNHRGQPPSYFFPYERPQIRLPGLEKGVEREYLTDRITDEAVKWIEAQGDKPFFLYLPHYTVHTPLQAKPDLLAKYQTAKKDSPQKNPTYAAMIESLDESVGRIAAKLDELKLRERTLIVFTSDNGGLTLNNVTHNLGLRAGKGSAYEGGVRVPLIVNRPGGVVRGTSDMPVITCDWFATIAALAGIRENVPQADGVDLTPVLSGKGKLERDAIYWHYPHYHPGGATPYSAVREGNLRLVEFYETGKRELYDLFKDPLESQDLADERPKEAQRLAHKLSVWRERVGAQAPVENPQYDPAKDGKK